MKVRFEFKPQDLWIGAFWKKGKYDYLPQLQEYHLWICLLPCFPLHIRWTKHQPQWELPGRAGGGYR